MDSNQLTISEIVFIVGLFILLPLGILLVRLISHRNLSFRKASDFRTFGKVYLIVFSLFALSYFIKLFMGRDVVHRVFVVCCVAYFLPSLYFFWESRKRFNKLNTLYTYYRHITIVKGEASIGVIAQLTKQRPVVVKNDILRMMFVGILEKGFIDDISNQIVFYNRSNSDDHNQTNQVTINMMTAAAVEDEDDHEVKKKKAKVIQLTPQKVECSGCGSGSTLQPGETIDCPYCGTSMVYPK